MREVKVNITHSLSQH